MIINTGESIDKLLERKVIVLEELIKQLNQLKRKSNSRLTVFANKQEVSLLESRIEVNVERGNQLAAQRDKTKLNLYKVDQSIKKYLEFLIESSNNYLPIDDIVEFSQKELDASLNTETKLLLPEVEVENAVFASLKDNHRQFLQASHTYRDILAFVISNPRKIASVHWFQEFSLLSAISYVNHFDFVSSVNYRLAPFKVDVGGISLSFIIIFFDLLQLPFCVQMHALVCGKLCY